MHTISLSKAETRSISVAAAPQAVFEFIADARNLPRWAPGFAEAVRADGDRWVVTQGEIELQIAVVASAEQGTVDLLRGPDLSIGAYSRVIPNTAGSEFLFTLLFPEGTPDEAVAAQMDVVDGELRTIRELVENGWSD
jgi:Polyketide cyclase / dehydrase and lipid transport